MKTKTKETLKILSPAIVSLICTIIALTIYLVVLKKSEPVRILQGIACPFIALVIPLINKLFKTRIPFAVNVLVTVHAIMAINLAGVLGFYDIIPGFDKFLHTYFGFYGSIILFILLFFFNGEKLKPFGFFLFITLGVMGLGALWEIFEFSNDSIIGTNCQVWKASQTLVDNGLTYSEYLKEYGSPLNDTMGDLIVTLCGNVIFYICLLIDKFGGYKLSGKIYCEVKGLPEHKEEKVAQEEQVN